MRLGHFSVVRPLIHLIMQRYTLTSHDEATATTRAVYDEFMRLSGAQEPPLWMTSLGDNPTLVKAYWEKTRGCLLEGSLPLLLKEMVMFVVSRENEAEYDQHYHAHVVLQLDPSLSYEQLLSILDPLGMVPIAVSHKVALNFSARMAHNAKAVTDDDFDLLSQVGFSPSEIKELLGVIDLAMMFNCYTNALRLPVDPLFKASTAH